VDVGMTKSVYNVLFLCTGNSARSIMAEAILNKAARGHFRAFSAGSQPKGNVNRYARDLLAKSGYDPSTLRSKSWAEFARNDAPKLDFVFTVCDNAAGEACPLWPGQPITAHWGIPDPAAATGTEAEIALAFKDAYRMLKRRIDLFLALPLAKLDRPVLTTRLQEIGRGEGAKPSRSKRPTMSTFERYLTVWVALCIVAGIALGHLMPQVFQAIGGAEIARVNLPVAALIWLMIIPMLVKIDFAALARVREHWRGIGVTLFINWAVKPFSMAALGWLFIGYLFRPYLPPEQINSYIAGLIILAAAPCTAMVFVWSNLTKGEPHFTLSQVALNDTIMVFAFAPIVGLLLGLSAITVPWGTLVLSVVLYIVVPVLVAQLLRRRVLAAGGAAALARLLGKLQPLSLVALLATLVLLFGFQGDQILAQPLVIVLLAVPILIQVYFNAGLAYMLNRMAGEQHCVAGPSALIGASNFFELAVAAAISLFGFNSGAALATVVGVLIEVPVMLSVVAIVNRSRDWYERGAKPGGAAATRP
jgi:ACR3 family arsenite transporter